jgi:hypothetical protein
VRRLLILGLVSVIAGCGGSGEDSTTTSEANNTEAGATGESGAEGSSAGADSGLAAVETFLDGAASSDPESACTYATDNVGRDAGLTCEELVESPDYSSLADATSVDIRPDSSEYVDVKTADGRSYAFEVVPEGDVTEDVWMIDDISLVAS